MPVYEYKCEKCTCHFEVKRGFNDTTAVKCPECRARARRIFSPVPIIFKGSGFYVTDNAAKNSSLETKPNGDKPASDAGKETTAKKEVKAS